jgi:GRASP55/65 PDZ-like domain
MGNATSVAEDAVEGSDNAQLNASDEHYDDPFEGIETLGYRVLGVQPNSPAAAAGLVSFLDFLVGAENKMLLGSGEGLEPGEEYDDVDLPRLLEEKKGKTIELRKYYFKSMMLCPVSIVLLNNFAPLKLFGI